MKSNIYQLFGSQNSLDVDVVFFVEKLPESILEKLSLSKEFGQELKKYYPNKQINANLARCINGCLVEVYKGTTDELNNALFFTYHLHKQKYENQISILLKRDIDLKFLRSARMILSFLSKTNYRIIVKEALKGNIHSKIAALKMIDIATITNFGKGQNSLDITKSIAFQIGQCIALHNEKELYQKDEIADYLPDLKDFLSRHENQNLHYLQIWISKFTEILIERAKNMTVLLEYKYELMNKI
jgi:hypothetical protein